MIISLNLLSVYGLIPAALHKLLKRSPCPVGELVSFAFLRDIYTCIKLLLSELTSEKLIVKQSALMTPDPVTAVSRNAHVQSCGWGTGVEVWTAVRSTGVEIHLHKVMFLCKPPQGPALSKQHTQFYLQTRRTHSSQGCLNGQCYQHSIQPLVSAQEVTRATSHSCLSLFSSSLLLHQMVVSATLFFFYESVERNSICVLMNIYNLKTEVFSAFIVWFIFVVFISHFIFRPQHRTL